MYEVFRCLGCQNVFSMDDKERIEFCESGNSTIKCPKCGCVGLDIITCIDADKMIKNVLNV